MGKLKVCIDIGGTKTIVAILNEQLKILNWTEFFTPNNKEAFISLLNEKLDEIPKKPSIINVAIPGRIDENGRVVMSPNSPLLGLDIRALLQKKFKTVTISNDANCFAVYELFKGKLKHCSHGLIIVWGTGIGGSLVINRKIYSGKGFASELGHIAVFDKDGEDIESMVGGAHLKTHYGNSGAELNALAMANNETALLAFEKIGKVFGRLIYSLIYAFDPERIILGGSMVKSWKFMKNAVDEEIKKHSIRGGTKISINTDKFYVIKGCYFLDNYEKTYNKL